jgi:hypothetical protein
MGRRKWAALYVFVCATLGTVSAFVFLNQALNIMPLWVVTGPPCLVLNVLSALVGLKVDLRSPGWCVAVVLGFVAYYCLLFLPALLMGLRRAPGSAPRSSTRLLTLQVGLLVAHGLLLVLLRFINARA